MCDGGRWADSVVPPGVCVYDVVGAGCSDIIAEPGMRICAGATRYHHAAASKSAS